MDEYAQIYWLDERNAGRDHRTPGAAVPASWRPGTPAVVRAPAAPPAVRYPAGMYPAQATVVAQPMTVMQQPAPYYGNSILGGFTLGQLIEMAAQALAAFQSLPAAPIATAEVAKDVGNLVLYQTAIAQHAKRDEQLRTLGALISKLVK